MLLEKKLKHQAMFEKKIQQQVMLKNNIKIYKKYKKSQTSLDVEK